MGNQLQDANGKVIVLHGVERSGTEYSCEDPNNPAFQFEGPSGDTEMAAIASWTGMNNVGLMLSEDCWLGINGVNPKVGGQNYINYIKSEVAAAEAHGLYPVLSPFRYGPGTSLDANLDNGNPPMPDNDHMPLFWQQIANTFKGDPKVIFRLAEEPHPNIGGYDTAADWACWSKGDVQYSVSGGLTPVSQSANCQESYKVVGMQSLLNVIRGTGARNVVQAPGIGWADIMACGGTGNPNTCGFLDSAAGVRLSDPAGQLMADVNVFPNANECNSPTCYQAAYAPIIAVMPMGGGETDATTGNGPTSTVDTFMNWMDQHGAGYSAKAWDTWANTFLADYNGTPASPWGTDYKAHIAKFG